MSTDLLSIAEARLSELKTKLSENPEFQEYLELKQFVDTGRKLISSKALSSAPEYNADQGRQQIPASHIEAVRSNVRIVRREKDPRIIPAVEEILRAAGHPMRVGDILDKLTAKEIEVTGKIPSRNLSAKLSYSDKFVSKGDGWALADDGGFDLKEAFEPQDNETPSAANTEGYQVNLPDSPGAQHQR